DDVFVRGAIDRIDRAPDGTLIVLDYKSGRIEPLRRKLRPDTLLQPEFQLPLYAALLRQRNPGARVDAQYVSLKSARRTARRAEAHGKKSSEILGLRKWARSTACAGRSSRGTPHRPASTRASRCSTKRRRGGSCATLARRSRFARWKGRSEPMRRPPRGGSA